MRKSKKVMWARQSRFRSCERKERKRKKEII
jgi:hypothetical protein